MVRNLNAEHEIMSVVVELGDEVDLLFKPDEWLENQRVQLQQQMSLLAGELSAVLLAQRTRQRLSSLIPIGIRPPS